MANGVGAHGEGRDLAMRQRFLRSVARYSTAARKAGSPLRACFSHAYSIDGTEYDGAPDSAPPRWQGDPAASACDGLWGGFGHIVCHSLPDTAMQGPKLRPTKWLTPKTQCVSPGLIQRTTRTAI